MQFSWRGWDLLVGLALLIIFQNSVHQNVPHKDLFRAASRRKISELTSRHLLDSLAINLETGTKFLMNKFDLKNPQLHRSQGFQQARAFSF
jgi:hypothetical protein